MWAKVTQVSDVAHGPLVHFQLLLQNRWTNLLPKLVQIILRQRGFRIVQMKDTPLPQGEIIAKE
jgi:acetolactate synthase regulatory subunit